MCFSSPGKSCWQSPGPAADRPPWPPWFPSRRCTPSPTPASRSCPSEPPRGPRRGSCLHAGAAAGGRTRATVRNRDGDRAQSPTSCPPGDGGSGSVCVSGPTHRLLEAHRRNIASHRRVLLVAAAQSVFVELTLGDGLLESRTPHLVHVDRTHP